MSRFYGSLCISGKSRKGHEGIDGGLVRLLK